MLVKSYDAFNYLEVFKIVEMRDGLVYKTKTTGKYIRMHDAGKLDPKVYVTSSISTRLLRQDEFEIELMEIV